MHLGKFQSIDAAYKEIIENLKNGDTVSDTLEIRNCCFVVSNPTLENIRFPYRKVSAKYIDAELQWYWSANNSCNEIGRSAKRWLEITDDGSTSNSAYGYILFKKYEYNQLEQIIEILKSDKHSRRAILNISDPELNKHSTKDLQCTIGIQFLIRENKLEETVYMRSNDVVYGLPYDYIFFVMLGKYIAEALNVEFAQYTHHATSMHLYENNVKRVQDERTDIITVEYDKYIKLYKEQVLK